MSMAAWSWRAWFGSWFTQVPPVSRSCVYPSRAGLPQPQPTLPEGATILGASLLLETSVGVIVVPIVLNPLRHPMREGDTVTFEHVEFRIGPAGVCR